ncbi:cytochrome P450 2F2-like [Rhinatrema bivittatum]|uniref:cytochrome P450 2F2-like n=1 Tax=Rhinatrema bivittatum TaxID=194408 RepID=UPI00112A284D|nr:cytochrome P450 2F2-like [Rhinatrema bivittatum]XP_029426899.1 cytochrome P450 2F2-like [Rhinatrema bivittatum]XP_029426900.1 cytochrome P450 2F2-like [Rhinatrema bivittatum]XP_029426901.1 cytochrome P450 2F2-like [Rhinatrema bivittatum]XP_029426902.1 cytochrome P450 2F2-like [Rhinatrema bivittatum]
MDFGAVLFLLLIACISYMIVMYGKMLQKRGQLPPGPMPLPIIGNLLQVNTDNTAKSLIALSKKYGPVFTIHLGSKPRLILCGYETVKEALIDQAEEFGGRGPFPVFLNFTKGNDLAFSNGEKWKDLHKFVLQTLRNFGMGKRSIEERIQEEVQFLITELRKTKQLPFDPTLIFGRAISNVIFSVVFGSRFNYEDKTFRTIVSTINENFHIISSFWGTMYNIYPEIMDYLPGPHKKLFANHEVQRVILQDAVKAHQETLDPDSPRDFIDAFLIKMQKEKKNPTTSFFTESLIMTVHTLLYGGTDTVTTTLRYGVLILMKFPEVAEKIQEEINQVIGQNRPPAMEDRKKMPYTDAVIQEIQRFASISPLALPHLVMQDTQLKGYKIPKDITVIAVLASVHHDPAHYEKPEVFNPANFLDEKGCIKKNDALMIFSAGQRICPGENLARMEVFLFFTTLLQNFTFQPLGSREDINLTPVGSNLENLPQPYQCCAIPR